jgi:neutral ceramidase
MTGELRAGAARAALAPDLGVPMMGYGAREGAASSRRDPLFARGLYLEGGGRALLVECDLCLLSVAQAAAVRRRIAERTGLPPEAIGVGCIHTHSGPETGLGHELAGHALPGFVAPLLDAAVEAGVAAVACAEPARLAAGRAEARIGRNRRSAAGPLDPGVPFLRVDRSDGSPLAVLYVHGCHPTVLGHDNLAYSADWPGAASRSVEEALPGALAVFALGAHGDVDPRTRGLLDLAIPDQSLGASFEEMERLGRELGEAVAKEAAALRPAAGARVAAGAVRVPLAVHAAGPGAREHLAAARAEALRALDLPADADPPIAALYAIERERLRGLPAEEVRARASRVRLYLRDRTARRLAGGARPEVEAQVLQLGPLRLLGLPLEACVDVGLAWRERAGSELAAVVSIANGWLRYLPHPRNFEEAGAEERYEVLMSTFTPDAALRLVEAGGALAERLAVGA